MNSFHNKKIIYFNNISSTLKSREAVRCFIAILFLAKDKKVELKQLDNDDIEISLINNAEINTKESISRLEVALYVSDGR